MANVSRKGFWPVGTLSGSPWQGSVKRWGHGAGEARSLGIGDMCVLTATGNVNIAIASALNIVGSLVSREVIAKQTPSGTTMALSGETAVDLSRKYIKSAEVAQAYVCTAPDAIYECESANGTPTVALIGAQVNLFDVAAGADTTTGLSKQVVDVGNPVVAAGQFKVVGLVARADNEAASNMKIQVVINNPFLRNTTGV